jgi:hypothetical protein
LNIPSSVTLSKKSSFQGYLVMFSTSCIVKNSSVSRKSSFQVLQAMLPSFPIPLYQSFSKNAIPIVAWAIVENYHL